MLSPFEDFASGRGGIDAVPVTDRAYPKTPGEWAEAIFEHWKATRQPGEKKSEDEFAHAAHISRGGFTKLRDGDRRPRADTIRKLSAIAPQHLKDFPWAREDSEAMSDPDRTVHPQQPERYRVDTMEAGVVAQALDAIADSAVRRDAMTEAMLGIKKALQNPSELGAERGPGRAQRK